MFSFRALRTCADRLSLGIAAGLLATSAQASLIGNVATCSGGALVLACATSSAQIDDPGVEFNLVGGSKSTLFNQPFFSVNFTGNSVTLTNVFAIPPGFPDGYVNFTPSPTLLATVMVGPPHHRRVSGAR